MRPTFEKTVDILVKAYLNDTLEHGTCTACAVGNIVANSIGCSLKRDTIDGGFDWYKNNTQFTPIWNEVFASVSPRKQNFNIDMYQGWHKKQIDSTGYTVNELALIEYAFESVPILDIDDRYNSDEHMYLGLMAVVDVLAEIHVIDLKQREEAKLLFQKS